MIVTVIRHSTDHPLHVAHHHAAAESFPLREDSHAHGFAWWTTFVSLFAS